jgi:hypothetical protein
MVDRSSTRRAAVLKEQREHGDQPDDVVEDAAGFASAIVVFVAEDVGWLVAGRGPRPTAGDGSCVLVSVTNPHPADAERGRDATESRRDAIGTCRGAPSAP